MRSTNSTTTTTVRYFAKPMGAERENGPHLSDLRAFVAECDGLPDDVSVRINNGNLSESGRRDVELSVAYKHPDPTEGATP